MSFSRATPSPELKRALDYAARRGLILVASAGNDGQSLAKYPAAYSNVMSVASTADDDTRSTFSNYGSTVWVAAPGEAVLTTYPWGSFAAAWGTSFSTPLVAGAAALVAGLDDASRQGNVSGAIAQRAVPDAGAGPRTPGRLPGGGGGACPVAGVAPAHTTRPCPNPAARPGWTGPRRTRTRSSDARRVRARGPSAILAAPCDPTGGPPISP